MGPVGGKSKFKSYKASALRALRLYFSQLAEHLLTHYVVFPPSIDYKNALLLAGPIPRELGNLALLTLLAMGGNQLSGESLILSIFNVPDHVCRVNPLYSSARFILELIQMAHS